MLATTVNINHHQLFGMSMDRDVVAYVFWLMKSPVFFTELDGGTLNIYQYGLMPRTRSLVVEEIEESHCVVMMVMYKL